MKQDLKRRLEIPGLLNVRDLGGYRTSSGLITKWRRLLRGDGLHRLTREGVQLLNSEGLTSVIDLRSQAELEEEPNPYLDQRQIGFYHKPVYDDLAPAMTAKHSQQKTLLSPLTVLVMMLMASQAILLVSCSIQSASRVQKHSANSKLQST